MLEGGAQNNPYRFKLNKSLKGGRYWELEMSGDDIRSIVDEVLEIDRELDETFAENNANDGSA